MRNIMGSWPFVFAFFAVMIAWATLNTVVLEGVLHTGLSTPTRTSC